MANEKRLIDADALRDALYDADALTMKGVAIINQFPTVDAVEVVHGKWIKGKYPGEYTCSKCGMEYCEADPEEKPYKHCPECGSKNE